MNISHALCSNQANEEANEDANKEANKEASEEANEEANEPNEVYSKHSKCLSRSFASSEVLQHHIPCISHLHYLLSLFENIHCQMKL